MFFRDWSVLRDALYSITLPRRALVFPRWTLRSVRRLWEPLVGLVGRRALGTNVIPLISACSRSMASIRFFSWVRYCCDLMTMTPSLLMRRSFRASSLCLYTSGSEEALTSNRRCIADETLLTFWPPAPCALMAVSSISWSAMVILLGVWSTRGGFQKRCPIKGWFYRGTDKHTINEKVSKYSMCFTIWALYS